MLHAAVSSKSSSQVKKALDVSYVNVNERDKYMQTPLHVAAYEGLQEIFELLIMRNLIDVNAKDKNHWTPLHSASSGGSLSIIDRLLDHPNINVSIANRNGQVPFHYFVRNKVTPAEISQFELVMDKFISRGADINMHGHHGFTPLHEAVVKNNLTGVRSLVNRKAQVNTMDKRGETPLHHAVRNSNAEISQFLMAHGADKTRQATDGTSPMDIARQQNLTFLDFDASSVDMDSTLKQLSEKVKSEELPESPAVYSSVMRGSEASIHRDTGAAKWQAAPTPIPAPTPVAPPQAPTPVQEPTPVPKPSPAVPEMEKQGSNKEVRAKVKMMGGVNPFGTQGARHLAALGGAHLKRANEAAARQNEEESQEAKKASKTAQVPPVDVSETKKEGGHRRPAPSRSPRGRSCAREDVFDGTTSPRPEVSPRPMVVDTSAASLQTPSPAAAPQPAQGAASEAAPHHPPAGKPPTSGGAPMGMMMGPEMMAQCMAQLQVAMQYMSMGNGQLLPVQLPMQCPSCRQVFGYPFGAVSIECAFCGVRSDTPPPPMMPQQVMAPQPVASPQGGAAPAHAGQPGVDEAPAAPAPVRPPPPTAAPAPAPAPAAGTGLSEDERAAVMALSATTMRLTDTQKFQLAEEFQGLNVDDL